MIQLNKTFKNEYYIRIMKESLSKIIRTNAIRHFLSFKTGSIHDLLEYVNNEIMKHDGNIVGLRVIQKDIKRLKSELDLDLIRYKPNSDELISKYGKKGEKQYAHDEKPINLSNVLFIKLKEGCIISEKLNKEENKTLSDAAIILKRFQGKEGFEMIDDVIDGLNDCESFVSLLLENKITNEENNAYRNKEYLKIKEALILNKPLSIRIEKKYNNKEVNIEFHPHHLKMWNNKWYVFGYAKDYDFNPYVLPIDLYIKDVNFITKKFISSEIIYSDSNGSTFFDDIIGVTNDIKKPVENIILRATNKDRFQRMKFKPIHKSCVFNDETYEINLKVKINPELINIIMEHIDEIEVLKPKNLKDILISKLNKVPSSYNTN